MGAVCKIMSFSRGHQSLKEDIAMDGVMEMIRGLLAQGKSSREIIDAGFAPRTVYKVQQEFRRRRESATTEIAPSDEATLRRDIEDVKARMGTLEARDKIPEAMHGAVPEAPPDPCPMCGDDVGWSKLSARRSPLARFLVHGYYRRCPRCHRERQVEP